MVQWLQSPDGSVWHPDAQTLGVSVRLLLSTLVGSLVSWCMWRIVSSIEQKRKEVPIVVLHPIPPQVQRGWEGNHLESTEMRASDDKEGMQIRCFDSSTGWHLGTLEADTQGTIDTKLDLATEASEIWGRSSWAFRRKLLKSLLEWVIVDQDILVRVACRDTGKTAVDAFFGEILTTSAKLKYLIANVERVLRPEQRGSGHLLLAHKKSTLYHKPYGVVAASVSWNYPLHNVASCIAAALASGNAIVVKPSEQVAWSTTYFVQSIHRILQKLDLPTSLVTLVLTYPSTASYLTKHPSIKHITFIGSEGVGRKVMIDAAENLTPVVLELGGKDPAIVLPGAKVSDVASVFMRAAFQGVGQNCIGIERFVVHNSLVDELVKTIVPRVQQLRCGSWLQDSKKGRLDGPKKQLEDGQTEGIDCGAMISSANFDTLESLINDAVAQGATLHIGGQRFTHPKWPAGHYFHPTVISGVTKGMRIAQTEAFAPIFMIMAFDTLEEAVDIANGTRMGLGSSVFGNDKTEINRVRKKLQCGMCNVNDFGVSYLNQAMPFGGVKASGFGRFAGEEGLKGLCYDQVVVEDRLFSLIRTNIPPPLDYPIKDSYKSYRFVGGLHRLAFADDWGSRVGGLRDIIYGAMSKN